MAKAPNKSFQRTVKWLRSLPSAEFKIRDQMDDQERRRAHLEQWLRPLGGEATSKSRNHLLVVAVLVVCYVKLGMRPEEILGFKLSADAPEQLAAILFGVLVYFWYLFVAQIATDMASLSLGHENQKNVISVRDIFGNMVVALRLLRFILEVILPNALAFYALGLISALPGASLSVFFK